MINKLKFPVVTTWAISHIIDEKNKFKIGTWGTHGTRFSNFAVQNSDLISIGSRLDTKATGSPINTFAREAKKIVVDIDKTELNKFKKFKLNIDIKVNEDLKIFTKNLLKYNFNYKNDLNPWYEKIKNWKKNIQFVKKYFNEKLINPYVFIDHLSDLIKENKSIVVDTGCAVAWTMQGFKFKKNQILLHDFNNTAMGWSIPASISIALATKKEVVVIIGDGSFSFMMQELSMLKT